MRAALALGRGVWLRVEVGVGVTDVVEVGHVDGGHEGGAVDFVGDDVGGEEVVAWLVGALDVGEGVVRRVVGGGGGAVVGECPASGGSPVT